MGGTLAYPTERRILRRCQRRMRRAFKFLRHLWLQLRLSFQFVWQLSYS